MNAPSTRQTPRAIKAFRIAGVKINAVTLNDVLSCTREWIQSDFRHYICLTGAHSIVEMQRNQDLVKINEQAGLVTPDGTPIVWIGKYFGFNLERVCASNLMPAIFDDGLSYGCRHFFLGSTPEVNQRLVARTILTYPGINIVGSRSPPFGGLTCSERDDIIEHINSSTPNIVWVGLGYPKQERFISEFRPLLNCQVLVGVGAGFDFLSCSKPLAPSWVSTVGLEWLFRMFTEPRRLGKRYVVVVPTFIYLVLKDIVRSLIKEHL